MLLKDSCLKDTLLATLLKDIHDNSTKQKYLPYSVNILKILSLPLYGEQMMLLSIKRYDQFLLLLKAA